MLRQAAARVRIWRYSRGMQETMMITPRVGKDLKEPPISSCLETMQTTRKQERKKEKNNRKQASKKELNIYTPQDVFNFLKIREHHLKCLRK